MVQGCLHTRICEVKRIIVNKFFISGLHDSLDESINGDVRIELSLLYSMLLGVMTCGARK